VVYQLADTEFGDCGVRYFSAFKDEADFRQNSSVSGDIIKILAINPADEEIDRYLCQTKPVCFITEAIENSCYEDDSGRIDPSVLNSFLMTAALSIEKWRKYREDHRIVLEADPLTVVISENDQTQRGQLMKYALRYYWKYNPQDMIMFISLIVAEYKALLEQGW